MHNIVGLKQLRALPLGGRWRGLPPPYSTPNCNNVTM